MNDPIAIYLTPNELDTWRKYQQAFMLLVEKHVFEIRNGSVEINFDQSGNMKIKAHLFL